MAQIFDRSSNALARASLVLTGLIVIALGVTLDQLQRSPWVTRQGQRPDQPVPFSHKHHVQGLGLQCQYCHVTVEKSSYAGIPPTKTCMNCHAQIWTNAQLLEPVRQSWATGQSLAWTKVHDLPDYVYFSHEIHVNKGLGCSSCHGRVDQMPLMYAQNTLQMEWCLDCHRNPAKNLRPTSEIYNMAWEKPAEDRPVWCSVGEEKSGLPTAQSVNCTTKDPANTGPRSLRCSCPRSARSRFQATLPRPRCRLRRPTKNSPARMSWAAFWWITTRFVLPRIWPVARSATDERTEDERKQEHDRCRSSGWNEAAVLKGHDFSRAANDPKSMALAPAGSSSPMTLAAVREELKAVKGKKYWRSIDELANTEEFQAAVEKEFPSAAQEWVDPVTRRGFMKLMGASMALAGLAGCTKQPDEPIYPYVKAPEDLILGKPMYFATAHPFTTGAVPLLAKSDQFRPIKIDGNPEHPYNQGSSDPFTQGTLLDLYDPDRSQHVTFRGENREWAEFAQELRLKVAASKDGTGIYFLSSTITSPTLARQWKAVRRPTPRRRWCSTTPPLRERS